MLGVLLLGEWIPHLDGQAPWVQWVFSFAFELLSLWSRYQGGWLTGKDIRKRREIERETPPNLAVSLLGYF